MHSFPSWVAPSWRAVPLRFQYFGRVTQLFAAGTLAISSAVLLVYAPALLALVCLAALGLALIAVLLWLRGSGLDSPRPADVYLMVIIPYLAIAPALGSFGNWPSVGRLILAISLIVALLSGVIPVRSQPMKYGGWLVLAFALYQCVPLVANGVGDYGLLRLGNWIIFVPLAFVRYDERNARYAFGAVLLTSLVLFVGILLQMTGMLPGVWGGFSNGDLFHPVFAPRYTSFLQNPNDLGLFMACAGLFSYLYLIQPGRSLRIRLFVMAVLLLATYSVILSSSRGAILAVPFVLLGLFFLRTRRALLRAVIGAVVCYAIVSVGFPSVRTTIDRNGALVGQVISGSDRNVTSRLAVWHRASSRRGNVLVGAGYGGYGPEALVASFSIQQRHQIAQGLTVDNGWLKLYLEEGLIGILLFGAILFYLIRNAYLSRALTGWRLPSTLAIAAALAMIFRAFSADVFDINPWDAYIWMAFGVAASARVFCYGSHHSSPSAVTIPKASPPSKGDAR